MLLHAGSGDEGAAEGLGECTSQELSKLLVWLLVVGYQLRVLEVRLDLEATMLVSSMDEVRAGIASAIFPEIGLMRGCWLTYALTPITAVF